MDSFSISIYSPKQIPTLDQLSEFSSFLFTHLEQYGDKEADIRKAMDYALSITGSPGGFLLTGYQGLKLIGVVVVNRTGMDGYIPENILVYIAVHPSTRGQGFGKQLMQKALDYAEGSVALHVEPDNPARKLYENLGFTNKYLEMRYIKPTE